MDAKTFLTLAIGDTITSTFRQINGQQIPIQQTKGVVTRIAHMESRVIVTLLDEGYEAFSS